ncbi:peptidoglycan-binding protein [Candidatus Kaiserbacteria bacterium]|nr:peptidoglycan-binding protein [Candidatus Kaiserbacteria bacterium]
MRSTGFLAFGCAFLLISSIYSVAAASTCPNLTRNLSFGSRGQDVVELQSFLIAQGFLATGNNTGNFYSLTEAAVKQFQCRNNLVCSGTRETTGWGNVGPKTRAKIQQVCTAQTGPIGNPASTINPSVPAAPSAATVTLCSYYWSDLATGWRSHAWLSGDCSNGLPGGDFVAIGQGDNSSGTGGQVECSNTAGSHYNNPNFVSAGGARVTCLYVPRSTPQPITRCSYFWNDFATGWREHTWTASDCSNGLPQSGGMTIGQPSNGAGIGGQVSCSLATGSYYNHPTVPGSTNGNVTCLYVGPSIVPRMTTCSYDWSDFVTGWREHAWLSSDCPNGLPQSGWLSIGQASNGAGTGGQVACTPQSGSHYNNPSTAGTTSSQVKCLFVSPPNAESGSCSQDGVTLASGQSQTFFQASTVTAPNTCTSIAQTRTCTNGILSGAASYQYSSCSVKQIVSCKPPRHYQYVLLPGQEKLLKQNPTETTIFNVTVPDSGRAIARTTLAFRSNATTTNEEYGWAARIFVGSGTQEDDIAYGQQGGEDMCPQQGSGSRAISAYGTLGGPSSNTVTVTAHSSRFGGVDDMVSVLSGSYVDVWVEDGSPACVGKDIQATSFYHQARKGGDPNWAYRTFQWPTTVAQVVGLDVAKNPDRQNLKVISWALGSPDLNPTSQCGQEVVTLTSQQLVGGNIAAYGSRVLPPSQGQGHLLMDLESNTLLSTYLSAFRINLLVGKSFENGHPVLTGNNGGDAFVGVIQY